MSCGADTEANTLLASLLTGEDVVLPEIDFDSDTFKIPDEILQNVLAPVTKLNNGELTDGTIGGSGTFDVLMRGFKAHLKEEYDKSRITGAEYTKAYIALTESAMAQAVQFLTNRDQVYWQAVTAQFAALISRTQYETAKMQLANAKFEALNAKAAYGLTKIKIASEDQAYCIAKYQLDNILPQQLAQSIQETENLEIQGNMASWQLANLLPKQLEQLVQETENLATQGDIASYQLANILPKDVEKTQTEIDLGEAQLNTAEYNLSTMLPAQKKLVDEQIETQRSQTLDNRTDGIPITGSVGKQKELYSQQITSYKRDAEVKAAKMWTDAWTVMKTIDEGIEPPDAFTNANLDQVLEVVATQNGFGDMG